MCVCERERERERERDGGKGKGKILHIFFLRRGSNIHQVLKGVCNPERLRTVALGHPEVRMGVKENTVRNRISASPSSVFPSLLLSPLFSFSLLLTFVLFFSFRLLSLSHLLPRPVFLSLLLSVSVSLIKRIK